MKLFFLLTSIALSLSVASCTKSRQDIDDTVYSVLGAKIKGLDPIIASDKYSHRIVAQIYEGLYGYHYLKRPLEITPVLAQDLPEISPDGLTYKIQIKKGIHFQNDPAFKGSKGREVVAEDFIYSWRRLADPKNQSPGFWIFNGRIKGLNEWRQKVQSGQASYKTPIAGLQAPDSHTLVIQLTEPFYQFTHLLTMAFTKVVPAEAVEVYGKDFINKPVGTGPYRLKKWTRGSDVRLIRNKHYREATYPNIGDAGDKEKGFLTDAGARLPLSDNIVIKIMPERQPLWLNFLKGDLDFAMIPKDDFAAAYSNGQLSSKLTKMGVQVHKEHRPDVTFFAFNMEDPLFRENKKLRSAMAMAYDSKTCLERFYNQRGIVAQAAIPPNIDGYDSDFESPVSYDVQRAKKLLAEAGYPEGKGLPEIKFELGNSASVGRQMGEYMKQQMAKIGVKIRLVNNTWPQFEKKVKSKKAAFFAMAWVADYPDGENFLQLFYSKNKSPGSNNSNFFDPEFDRLYKKAALMAPSQERTQLYQKMNQYVAAEVPMIFNVHRTHYLPYHSWLKNYKENSIIHDFYKYLRVEPQLRSKRKAKF